MALTADTATIETLSGTRQTYRRRRSIAYGEVALPWELGPLGSGKDTACAYCGRRELPGDPLMVTCSRASPVPRPGISVVARSGRALYRHGSWRKP